MTPRENLQSQERNSLLKGDLCAHTGRGCVEPRGFGGTRPPPAWIWGGGDLFMLHFIAATILPCSSQVVGWNLCGVCMLLQSFCGYSTLHIPKRCIFYSKLYIGSNGSVNACSLQVGEGRLRLTLEVDEDKPFRKWMDADISLNFMLKIIIIKGWGRLLSTALPKRMLLFILQATKKNE